VNPRDRLRSVSRRVTDPAETLAQQVTERVLDLLVDALDVNELAARIDVNAILARIDVNAILAKTELNTVLDQVDVNALLARADLDAVVQRVDVGAVLDRVDVNEVVGRIDIDALVEKTDLGAVIAQSSGGLASDALDAVRSQAVGLDLLIDRWVNRLLRRKHQEPSAPSAQLSLQAEP
jgi:hypothetical protein